MIELKTAEHVIQFMNNGNISLSRYDEKFLSSLSVINRVTTNQVELFYKLIYKYARQLSKHELSAETLINLPWIMPVVESLPEYTRGHIEIIDDMLTFKCPFNRQFINEFRKQENNTFVWSNINRRYETLFSPQSLQMLLNVGPKFYKDIKLCNVTQKLIDDLHSYSACTNWDPTLKMINGNLMISSINETLYELTKDIPLEATIDSLAKFAEFGVIVSEEVYGNDEKLRFASSIVFNQEAKTVINIIPWLHELGCDMIYISGSGGITPYRTELMRTIKDTNMPHHELAGINYKKTPLATTYKFPVLIKLRPSFDNGNEPYKVSKIINVRNSEPITIK
jgi:hypothetical protein